MVTADCQLIQNSQTFSHPCMLLDVPLASYLTGYYQGVYIQPRLAFG